MHICRCTDPTIEFLKNILKLSVAALGRFWSVREAK